MANKYLLGAFCCMLTFGAAQMQTAKAQQNNPTQQARTIKGQVVDSRGETLPGAAVYPTGNPERGTATDPDGKFNLPVGPGVKSITVSFIGYNTRTIDISKRSEVKVVLTEATQSLEDVVVTGYQVIDKRYSTSATTSVKMEDINIPGITNVTQMLEGKIPDMVVTTNSSEINATPRLRIRGTSTLIGNREPLWVLDGIILTDPVDLSPDVLNDPDYVNRIGNAIAGINPQDIERIDVLKDAAATALYGTRAANGVIVVTTKSGRVGKPIVSYTATMTGRRRPYYSDRKIDLMNSADRIQFSKDLTDDHYYFPLNMPLVGYEYSLSQYYEGQITRDQFLSEVKDLSDANTDWFKILNHNSFSHEHTASVSGGSDDVRYYVSIGYNNQDDVLKYTDNERYSAHARIDLKLSSKFDLEFNANGYLNERKYNQSEVNPINYAYNTSRAIRAFNDDGSYHYYKKYGNSDTGYMNFNILNELDNSYMKQSVGNIIATVNLRYRPTSDFFINAIVSANYSSSNIEGFWGENTFHSSVLRSSEYGVPAPENSYMPYGGELSTTNTHTKGLTTRLQANYNKYFGKNEDHNINVALGLEASKNKVDGYSRTDRGFYIDRGKKFANSYPADTYLNFENWLRSNVPTITDSRTNLLSAYGTATYSFKNYFTLNINGRYDGSNQFGSRSNEKLLPIWSASGNAKLKDIFHIDNDWLDELTFKASYGEQGNMLDGQTVKLVIKRGAVNTYYNELTSSVSSFANPDLRWEKTHSTNIGLESSFFHGRLQLGIEGYYKKTTDAFLDKTIADINGYNSYVVNSGTIINKGYNITFSATPVKLRNFYWILSGNVSKVINEVKTAPGQETYELNDFLRGTAVVKGKPIGTFYSYRFLGLSPADGGPIFDDTEERMIEYSTMDNYDAYTTLLVASGKREPDVTGSVNNTFTYKQWRLGVSLLYSFGAKTRLFRLFDDLTRGGYNSEANVNNALLNRWRKPGDEFITNIPAIIGRGNDSYYNYQAHWDEAVDYSGAQIAGSSWDMYDYSTARVVSANYVKLSNIQLTYEFKRDLLAKWGLGRLAITGSAYNLYTFCSSQLKGQTPTQGGFSEVQLSDTPSYTLGLTIEF